MGDIGDAHSDPKPSFDSKLLKPLDGTHDNQRLHSTIYIEKADWVVLDPAESLPICTIEVAWELTPVCYRDQD